MYMANSEPYPSVPEEVRDKSLTLLQAQSEETLKRKKRLYSIEEGDENDDDLVGSITITSIKREGHLHRLHG